MPKRNRGSRFDISTPAVNAVLINYLRLQNRTPYLISGLEDGDCCSYTVLFLYAIYLELTQPKRYNVFGPIPRDDWTWLSGLYKKISRWDGDVKQVPNAELTFLNDVEYLISHLEFFQHVFRYLIASQDNLAVSLEDTRGIQLRREYSLAGLFTYQDFIKPLYIKDQAEKKFKKTTLLKELIKEDRLVLVFTHEHAMGIFRHNNKYYYHTGFNKKGLAICQVGNPEALLRDIFAAPEYKFTEPSPFGFIIFDPNSSYDNQLIHYPVQEVLLTALKPAIYPLTQNQNNITALSMAAAIGCNHSANYYLSVVNHSDFINARRLSGETSLFIASVHNHPEVVQQLLNCNADPIIPDIKGNSAMYVVVVLGFIEIVRAFLVHGLNPNAIYHEVTLLCHAIFNDNLEMLELLLSFNADPNQPCLNEENSLPLALAIEKENKLMIAALIAKGANVCQMNANGISPLMLALKNLDMTIFILRQPDIILQENVYQILCDFFCNKPTSDCDIKLRILEALVCYEMRALNNRNNLNNRDNEVREFFDKKCCSQPLAKEAICEFIKKSLTLFEMFAPWRGPLFWRQPPVVCERILKLTNSLGFTDEVMQAKDTSALPRSVKFFTQAYANEALSSDTRFVNIFATNRKF